MQQMTLKIRGLYTHPSDLSDAPPGALSVADNIVIDHEDIAEPRRGYNQANSAFPGNGETAKRLSTYNNYLYAVTSANALYYYNTQLATNTANFSGSGAWSSLGTFAPPTVAKTKFAEASQNLYFTSASGPQKLDSYNGTPQKSGAFKALDCQASIVSATGNWLAATSRVAYRVIWGYRDANNNPIQGTPSQRESVTNSTGSTASVKLTITVPQGVTTAWFYQVYRSTAVDQTAGYIEPSDELGLVYEANPVAVDISNKQVSFTDITPDSLRGATIYTAPSQLGIGQSYDQPPMATDMAVFRNVMFYARTTSKNRYFLTLLAAGGTNGIQAGDTVTLGGVCYTAGAAITGGTTSGSAVVTTTTTSGLAVGDTVIGSGIPAAATISSISAGVSFTMSANATVTASGVAVGVENYTTLKFNVASANSPLQNVNDTTISLVRVINRSSASTVYGFYLSGPNDLPGKMLIEEVSIGGAAFYCASNRLTCWSPDMVADFVVSAVNTGTGRLTATAHGYTANQTVVLSVGSAGVVPGGLTPGTVYYVTSPTTNDFQLSATSGGSAITLTAGFAGVVIVNTTAKASKNDNFQHGIYYSQTSQPEAVPIANYFLVGSAQKAILRILPLRDSLFILKQDGVFRLSGLDSSSFRVDPFDTTTHLLAPDSAVVLNNTIFCLADQGVVSISEAGVQVRSRPIEYDLLSLQGQNYSVLQSESFGISYETERKYILFVPTLGADTTPTQAYVFNTFTNTWTRWPLSKTCGIVNSGDDKLYLGDANTSYVNQERKSFSYQDYVDYGFSASITAVSGNVLSMTKTDSINVGDVIYQSSSVYSTVSAVDQFAGTVTTTVLANFTVASTSVLKAISSSISWVPFTGQNPGILKQMREISVLFKSDFTGNATLNFTSDTSPSIDSETLVGTPIGTWGLFTWGGVNWGGTNYRRPIRVYIPLNKQRCSQLTINFTQSTGYAKYQLNGVSIFGNFGSEKVAY